MAGEGSRIVAESNAVARPRKVNRTIYDWADVYCSVLTDTGSKGEAIKAANVTWSTLCQRRKEDPDFAAMEAKALQALKDIIEAEAIRRGVLGWEEPIFGSGGKGTGTVQVGTIRRFSDNIFLRLAERTDATWRSKQQIEHSGELSFHTRQQRLDALAKEEAEMRKIPDRLPEPGA